MGRAIYALPGGTWARPVDCVRGTVAFLNCRERSEHTRALDVRHWRHSWPGYEIVRLADGLVVGAAARIREGIWQGEPQPFTPVWRNDIHRDLGSRRWQALDLDRYYEAGSLARAVELLVTADERIEAYKREREERIEAYEREHDEYRLRPVNWEARRAAIVAARAAEEQARIDDESMEGLGRGIL
ncbi:hypothetical protein [Methylobacterium frigidaeris]|uniref:Uncharacterized protein n=1 Tax=Methylobacterium frigidaeris TaxID=2038277 RepID=A0AA37HHH0_9HYPH|nr:hypothetical protein [Methylobacterium frigidaeris]GJD65646.1 hypothetical protein MPEAHAMD_5841 [Methylobacterium frigidaeris]